MVGDGKMMICATSLWQGKEHDHEKIFLLT